MIKDFVLVVEKYLKDEINERHYKLHHILQNDYYSLCNSNVEKENSIKVLENNFNTFKEEKQKEINQLNEQIKKQNQIIKKIQFKLHTKCFIKN